MSTLRVTASVEQEKQYAIMSKVQNGRSIFMKLKETRDDSLFAPDKIYNNIIDLIHFYQYTCVSPPSDLRASIVSFFELKRKMQL